MKRTHCLLLVLLVLAGSAWAQDASGARSVYGSVTKIDAAAQQLVVRADGGGEISVTLQPKVNFRKVALGETDIRNAATIAFADINVGDRVMTRGKSSEDQKSVAANLIV